MPEKTKKKSPAKTADKAPARKFVVEEKSETSGVTPEKIEEPEIVTEPVNETPPVESEFKDMSVTVDPTPIETAKPEEPVLKSESEKDTLPSSVTSFSLLDSDENKQKTELMETEKETSNPPVAAVETTESTSAQPKSSQDEVNKWIENYDDKDVGEKKKGSGFFRIFLIILIVLSVFAIIAGGVYYYQKNVAKSGTSETSEPKEEVKEITPTQAPSPTPEKEAEKVDYTKLTLQILNGSGIPGEAGKVKDLLTELKFKSVLTANAANYDFEKTVIAVKDGVSDQAYKDISAALGKVYDMDKEIETLPASSKYDVVITVGQKI